MRAACDQTGEVGHVDEEIGVDRSGHRRHPLEVEDAWVRAVPGE